jgi:glycosyltransferase involved in cell wall biosynthesis
MEIDVLYAPAEVAPLLGRFPVVLGIQNLNVYTPNVIGRNWLERLRLRGLRALAHLSARRACAVIFVSEWARRFIAPQLHIPRQKQWVVHHGVNPAFLRATVTAEGSAHALLEEKTKERKMILAVSNLAPHKNYEVLLKSISLLPGKLRDNVLLVVVGKALEPVYTRIRDLISELKLEENVWFVGKVPHRELGLFYRKANVFVHPSREETFGLPVLEAMASGLPIICSRAGALPEIAGEAALYFDCNDAQSLTNLITQVLSDPGSVSGKASYGLQRVQAFSWERTAEKMIQIFQACVQPSLRH